MLVSTVSEDVMAGLSTDLVIEHMLMRSMKTSGGLTRGRVDNRMCPMVTLQVFR